MTAYLLFDGRLSRVACVPDDSCNWLGRGVVLRFRGRGAGERNIMASMGSLGLSFVSMSSPSRFWMAAEMILEDELTFPGMILGYGRRAPADR